MTIAGRPAGARIAVVSPHLDDAVLSAWLVLRSAPGARVVTCFAGVPGSRAVGHWDAVTGGADARAAVEARRAEDRRALARTGSVPVHLDLLDAQYRDPAKEGSAETSEDDRLSERLAMLLEPQLRDADEVWLPAALGGHVDHRLARRAALAATAGHDRRYLYADLPYAGQPAWPVAVTGGVRDAAVHLASAGLRTPTPGALWRAVLAEVPDVGPGSIGSGSISSGSIGSESIRLQRLTPAQRRTKYAAVGEYSSQLPALRCGRRNPLRRRRIFAYEVYWSLPSVSGTSQTAPSGGTRSSAEASMPCQGISSAVTPPRFPTPEPP